MPTISLPNATLHYEEYGSRSGRAVVLMHGYAMSSSIWRPLAARLAERDFFCIAPTWPLGAHIEPVRDRSCLTMEGIAALIDPTLESLDLEDVVLVGNDTGGAIAQIAVGQCDSRIGSLVLTNCDAFEHFPPQVLKPLIEVATKASAFRGILDPLGTRAGRKRGFGVLAHADLEPLTAEWTRVFLNDDHILDDLRHFTGSLNASTMIEASKRLRRFSKPVLIAWATDDSLFPLPHAERLAAEFPDARLETISDSRTFSMIDQPDRLADLISRFASD
jgi:pimeloyl-ACP methyl ester carboxylesterase